MGRCEADVINESGGPLWLLIDIAAVVALGAALIYGMTRWRSRRAKRLGDQKAAELYKRPDAD